MTFCPLAFFGSLLLLPLWNGAQNLCNAFSLGEKQQQQHLSRRAFVIETTSAASSVATIATMAPPFRGIVAATVTTSMPTIAVAAVMEQLQQEDRTSSSTSAAATQQLVNDNTNKMEYRNINTNVAFTFTPPKDCIMGNKPLKTHLEEINFNSKTSSGYQFGITVDPVRITTLKEFGTPEQVAARVVLAELNRDGIFNVTLMEDPVIAMEEVTRTNIANMKNHDKTPTPTTSSASTTTTTTTTNTICYYIINYLSQGKRGEKRNVCKLGIYDSKLYVLTAQCQQEEYHSNPKRKEELQMAVQSFHII